MTHSQLRRLQWAVRATLALGVAASVTANILHAQPNPISQAIAAWPPLALLITVELVTRIPVHQRTLGVLRIVAASTIAAIAAWISYHHMIGVVARYGETGTVPYLLPASVDGLIIVASVSLVELAARSRELDTTPHPPPVEAPPMPPPSPAHLGSTPSERVPLTGYTAPAVPIPLPEPPPTPIDGGTLHTNEDFDIAEHSPDSRSSTNSADRHGPESDPSQDDDAEDIGLPQDLVPLLPAARTARAELTREGQTVSRDALARRLRRNGHSIRNSGVSKLLAALRREERPVNGSRPTTSV
ncbi:DUF2637 domain-containing protein [Micromonospora tulbaghiae]|uniref:DUF2637 domain-containing protein n=1 Tax=Micromonospora tulbaghiae TaxID=479978 RepID=UPI0033E29ED1